MAFCLVAALLLSAEPPPGRVVEGLEEARSLVRKLQFGEAIEALERVRQSSDISPGDLRAVRELLAYCQVAEGRREAAENTYRDLLEANPSAELPRESASPKVLEVFQTTKAKMYQPNEVRLEEAPAPVGQADVLLVDPWRQVQVVSLFERRNDQAWASRQLEGEARRFRFAFNFEPAPGVRLEWYVEARNERGAVVARVGSAETPRVLSVPLLRVEQPLAPVPQAPLGRRGWGLVALGLGVAAAAGAIGLHVGGYNLRTAARDGTRPPGDFADTARTAETEGTRLQNWGTGLFVGAGLVTTTGILLVW